MREKGITFWGELRLSAVYVSLYSDALISGTLLTGETVPPRASQFLEIVNDLPASTHRPTNSESAPPTPISTPPQLSLFLSSSTLGHCPHTLIIQGPGMRQLETAPHPKACWNYLNQSILTKSASLIPSYRNHNKGSFPCFLLSAS